MHPTWSSERKSGFVALVMYRCTYVCGVNSTYTHLYTRLQLFLGICTRWLLWSLNQRIVALHSSSCACCSYPALSFPELPSLVPSKGLAGPVVEPAEPCESALPFSVGVWWWWWYFKGRKNRGLQGSQHRTLRLCKHLEGRFQFLMCLPAGGSFYPLPLLLC